MLLTLLFGYVIIALITRAPLTAAIARGLQSTGAVITSAALMLAVVVGPFALSGVAFTKLMGVGMIVALAVDATIVRVLLVPATMKLLGTASWWAPAPLRRFHDRHGFEEEDGAVTLDAPAPPPAVELQPAMA